MPGTETPTIQGGVSQEPSPGVSAATTPAPSLREHITPHRYQQGANLI